MNRLRRGVIGRGVLGLYARPPGHGFGRMIGAGGLGTARATVYCLDVARAGPQTLETGSMSVVEVVGRKGIVFARRADVG